MKYWILLSLFVILIMSGCIDEIKAQHRFCYNEVEMFIPEKFTEDGMCYDQNNELLFTIFNRGEQTIEKIKYIITDINKTINSTSPVSIRYNNLKVIGIKANFNPQTTKKIKVTPIVFYNVTNSLIECKNRIVTINNIKSC